MKVLVIGHANENKLNDNVFNVLTAATLINAKCDVLVVGAANLAELSAYPCIAKIIHLADISSATSQAAFLARALANISQGYSHVLTAADSIGKDLLPRIAGILGVGQISEVIDIISPAVFKRPLYAGNVIAQIESLDTIKLLTIRVTNFNKYKSASVANPAVIEEQPNLAQSNSNTQFIKNDISYSDTIDLAHAKIVVSGGRSLGSKEDFDKLIHGLALRLNAAVGASRAAVEAGYAPNDLQVGQTGKVVAPQIYLAIGISGAVQHIAGMKDSQTVIAINLDPNAQIFEYADYGLVGDLFEVVPQLTNLI